MTKARWDWDLVDWTWTNKQIMEATGACLATISYQRRKREGNQWAWFGAWSVIDWSKSNHEIAKATGRHRNVVAAARRKYAAETIQSRKAPVPTEVWRAVDWSKTNAEISCELDRSLSSVSNARKRHATKSFIAAKN